MHSSYCEHTNGSTHYGRINSYFIRKLVFMDKLGINWDQVRIDASISIMNSILSNSIFVFILEYVFRKQISSIAVKYADKLIDELKK